MITVSDMAQQQIDAFFADKNRSPIRIYLASGCGGARLALALDEPSDDDTVEEVRGVTYVVDKELYAQAQPMAIDMTPYGFHVESAMALPQGGGCGCSSGGGGGGCGSGGGGCACG